MKMSDAENNLVEYVRSQVKDLVDGKIEKVELSIGLPVGKMSDIFRSLGIEVPDSSEMETNGWEWDYWWKGFEINGRKYTLSGSGFYGGVRLHFYKE